MKSKIEFSKEDVILKKQFIDQNKAGSIAQQNQYSEKEEKENIDALKVIKGKVEVFHKNTDSEYLDSKSELLLVSERMLQFLKFTSVIFILLFILFVLKNSGVEL